MASFREALLHPKPVIHDDTMLTKVQEFAVFKMDLKMGPDEGHKSPNIKEIQYDIVVAIFAKHRVHSGFSRSSY